MYNKLKAVEGAVKVKTLLPGEYKVVVKDGEIRDRCQVNNVKYKSDWHCIYCDYRDECKGDVSKIKFKEL